MSTQKHYDGDINSKYVLILKEHNNCLHLHKYPIDNSELIISDIIDIVEDQNATVWDIYSRTCNSLITRDVIIYVILICIRIRLLRMQNVLKKYLLLPFIS